MRELPESLDLRKHSADLVNLLVLAIGVLEVEVRRPVRGLIFDNSARRAVAIAKVLKGCLLVEACKMGLLACKRL